ncbi:hypothetical protein BLGI_3243 [Brevibacillus laterosporus GI-9]|nr:hypothetical protein BLGI_3243 [Brevibacillus laterosporus GI-9]
MLFPIIQHVRPIFHSNIFFLLKSFVEKKEHLIIAAFTVSTGKTRIMRLLFF